MKSTSRILIAFLPLTMSAILGAWLLGLIGGRDPADEATGVASYFLGFIIFVGSLLSIIYLIGRLNGPMSQRELTRWESVRRLGKRGYLQQAVLIGLIPAIISGTLTIYLDSESVFFSIRHILIFLFLILLVAFCCYFAAARIWDTNERARQEGSNHRPHKIEKRY